MRFHIPDAHTEVVVHQEMFNGEPFK